jgi:hypothetical protein
VSGGSGPERIGGALASSGLFDLLGVRPAVGRLLTASDDRREAPPTVIVSDRLWQRRFAGRSDIVGETLKVNGVAHTIVGVMPAGFRFPEFADLWIPLTPAAREWNRDDRSLAVLARLGLDRSIGQARAEMRTLAADLEARHPETNRRWTAAVVSLREDMTGETAQASIVLLSAVTPDYFDVIGLGLREGRSFAATDSIGVVIVNEEMARRVWPGASAIGQRIRFPDRSSTGTWLTVVGVMRNEQSNPFGERALVTAYVPFAGVPGRSFAVYASGLPDAARLAPEVRAAVAGIDPDQPIEGLMTMAELRAEWVAPARFVAILMSSLAGVALLMAAMGTFGVIAYGVSQRTREIGVRVALGATPQQVQRMVVRGGAILATAGLAVGVPGAWLSTRALEGILAGTSPTDPAVFAVVSAILATVALAATWLPARRAAKVDPLVALRES